LIKRRNLLEQDLTTITNRPAELGHIGEFIASKIFHIKLQEAATHKGSDGHFTEGILKDRTVNIKWYACREGLLDINPLALPDFYLVLTGPRSLAMSSRGRTRPWLIENVFLFDANAIVNKLMQTGVKIGIASSLRQSIWADAEIYPLQKNNLFPLSEEQYKALSFFGSKIPI
jgi:hypothetical protein